MLVDLQLVGKNVLIVGGGEVGERKASKFMQEHCNVIVASKGFTPKLRRWGQERKAKLIKTDIDGDPRSIEALISNAEIVVAATDNRRTNEGIASQASKAGVLVCAVDDAYNSDFYLPAITNIGGIQIAICTGGKSPAMARILRQKIEKAVLQEDILQVELQSYARSLAKPRIPDKNLRRKVLYRIIRDEDVSSLLKKGLLEEAKVLAKKILEEY